jgi:hypothetical protein
VDIFAMSVESDFYREGSLLQRSFVFPQPDRHFELDQASPDELDKFGIVPKPDPKLQPELFAKWLSIFGPPITIVAPRIEEVLAPWQLNPSPPPSAAGASVSRFQQSGNWSGPYIVPTHDTMFVLVGGQWTLPVLQLPPAEQQVVNARQYVCSTWVGLDGQRRYLNSSLPQIGVMQTLTLSPFAPPQPSALAFFQWWDQEQTCATFLQLPGLSMQSGDVMRGAVWAKTATQVHAYLRNVTTSQLVIVGATAPSIQPLGGALFELTISGATAEWILERPTQVCMTDLFPFPAYSTTTFECWAGSAPSAGPAHIFHDLMKARYIRMNDPLHAPTRTVLISMPTRINDAFVRFDYGDFHD